MSKASGVHVRSISTATPDDATETELLDSKVKFDLEKSKAECEADDTKAKQDETITKSETEKVEASPKKSAFDELLEATTISLNVPEVPTTTRSNTGKNTNTCLKKNNY